MENRFGAPASGTPEGSARREFELLLLLGGSRKAAVQLWLRKQRIYANAQQAPHITHHTPPASPVAPTAYP